MTSNLTAFEFKVLISIMHLKKGILPVDSAVRVDKPFSVLQSKILKMLATI